MPKYLKKRGNIFHFQKRIPKAYHCFFEQKFVQVSLETESITIAQQRAHSFNLILSDFWKKLNPKSTINENQSLLDKVLFETQKLGFQYRTKEEIINDSSLPEFVNRISIASVSLDVFSQKAVLGGFDLKKSSIKLSKAKEEYFKYEEGNLFQMSDNQLRKWKNPRNKAIRNFIKIVGDKPVSEINRQDILEFRSWWIDRIEKEGLATNSANKEFSFIRRILDVAMDNHDIKNSSDDLFKGISLKRVEKTKRYPFTEDFIRDVLFQPYDVHQEVMYLIYAMSDTGARISEIIGLEQDDIVLDHDIPHIKIRPNSTRTLKTEQSERDLPLVGASLYAFKMLNGSFKHYFGKPDLISTTGNKFFRENNLFPSKHHSLYSLRHSFEDRLTAVEPPDKVQAALMGHKYIRPRYGDGPSLEQKRVWLSKIAFKDFG